MDHINDTVRMVVDRSASHMPRKEEIVHLLIRSAMVDLAMICKNIRETSIGISDRTHRIQKLSRESGLDFSTIEKIC